MAITRNRRATIYTKTLRHTSSGDYAITNEAVLVVDKSSGAATGVTLPAGVEGREVVVKDGKGDAATNNITITPASGTIDGSATYVLSENYGSVTLLYDGDEWRVASEAKPLSSTEMGFLNGVTAGTAAASKAVVLDSNSNVTGIGRVGADALRFEDIASIAAAGSVIGNATAIANRVQVVTGADGTKGVVLPTAVAGDLYVVYSSTATNGLKVYPAVNATINDGSANAAIEIEGKSAAIFLATSTTNWLALYTANA